MSLEFISNEHMLFPTPFWQIQVKGVDNEAIKEDSKYYGKDKRSDKGNIRYEGKRTSNKDSKAQQSFCRLSY